MPKTGDLLAKLALGRQLSRSEIEELRLQMNQAQSLTSQLASLLTPSGDLDPNIFSHHSGVFSILPHEAIYLAKGDSTQTLTTGVITTLNNWNVMAENGLSWDASNYRVLLKGISKESYYAIGCQVSFEAHATGFRQVLLTSRDAAGDVVAPYNVSKVSAVATAGETTNVNASTVYAMFADEASIEIQALQNSGGDLDVTNVNLWVTRLR
jgi:hypothetical protein